MSFDDEALLPEPDALPLSTPPFWPDFGADCCVPDVDPPAEPDAGATSFGVACGVAWEAPNLPVAPDAPPLLWLLPSLSCPDFDFCSDFFFTPDDERSWVPVALDPVALCPEVWRWSRRSVGRAVFLSAELCLLQERSQGNFSLCESEISSGQAELIF